MVEDQELRRCTEAVKGWAVEYLERSNTGCQEADEREGIKLKKCLKVVKDRAVGSSKRPETGRKRVTLRVIEVTRESLRPMFDQDSVKVEEYEVHEFDGKKP